MQRASWATYMVDHDVIVLVVHCYAREGCEEQVHDAFKRMGELVAANEPGCSTYRAVRARDDENHWLLFEQYDDEAAFQTHRNTTYFKEIVEVELGDLLENRTRRLYSAEVEASRFRP